MNIKDHIEAGHYPVDAKGRALVPMEKGVAMIYATDRSCAYPIIGDVTPGYNAPPVTWTADGKAKSWCVDAYDLLPPPPRKVKLRKYGALFVPTGDICDVRDAPMDVARYGCNYRIVELTGEYEEPWK